MSESSGVGQVSLQSTVPVNCIPQFDGACGVTVQLAHDQEYASKQCVGMLECQCYYHILRVFTGFTKTIIIAFSI